MGPELHRLLIVVPKTNRDAKTVYPLTALLEIFYQKFQGLVRPEARITVIDSCVNTVLQGLFVLEAAALRDSGMGCEEVYNPVWRAWKISDTRLFCQPSAGKSP